MAHSSLSVISLCAVLILVMIGTVSSGIPKSGRFHRPCGRGRPLQLPANQCLNSLPGCGLCGRPIDVTLIARNDYQDPKFEVNVTLTNERQNVLLHFLEQAVEANGDFKFESTYFATLGYFINSINGVRGEVANKTYWQIISETSGKSLECGVSTYVPVDEEVILFNFTTWENFDH